MHRVSEKRSHTVHLHHVPYHHSHTPEKTDVRQSDGTSSKAWICLYTGCVIRALHLDLVPDLSTAPFIGRLKRFAGLPAKMVLDTSNNLKVVPRIVNSPMTHGEVQQHFVGFGARGYSIYRRHNDVRKPLWISKALSLQGHWTSQG